MTLRLRTQLIFLIGGIILVPLLTLNGFILSQSLRGNQYGQESGYYQSEHWLRETIDEARYDSDGAFLDTLATHPRDLELLVVDRLGKVWYSTVPELASGSLAGLERVSKLMLFQEQERSFDIRHSAYLQERGLVAFSRIPYLQNREGRSAIRTQYQVLLGSVIAAGLLSLVLMLGIIRSLSRSFSTIEAATRKIADGDLDQEVQAQGPQEMVSLVQAFNTMRLSLREEGARRSRFVMGLSHDLKTPLAMMRGYTEALLDGMVTDEATRQRYLKTIDEKNRHLEERISELIRFVKLETADWRQTLQAQPVTPFFHDLARQLREDMAVFGRPLETTVQLPADLMVVMDLGLVRRAVENLIQNALRYSDSGGRVEFSVLLETLLNREKRTGRTGPLGRRLVIRVTNTGPGIPSQDLPRIFDPLFRGTHAGTEGGFGLGLAVVKSVVESHGWTIDVTSEPQGKTTFQILAELN